MVAQASSPVNNSWLVSRVHLLLPLPLIDLTNSRTCIPCLDKQVEGDNDIDDFDEGFEGDLEEEEEQECGGSENENRQNPVLLPPPTRLKARLHHRPLQ